MKVEPGNILKLFLNVSNFEPQYSNRLYSYKKGVIQNILWPQKSNVELSQLLSIFDKKNM